jgi:NADH-quinone oxidoreductase subunit A
MPSDYWPIAIYAIITVGLASVMLVLWLIVSPRQPTPQKALTYESGVNPVGEAQRRLTVRYYVIAMLFVLFDIETVFLYPWALVFDQIGLYALVEMILFIAMIIVAYVYAWKKGAFDWV